MWTRPRPRPTRNGVISTQKGPKRRVRVLHKPRQVDSGHRGVRGAGQRHAPPARARHFLLFWVSCHHTPTVILVFHYYYHFTISFFYQDTKLKPTRAMRLCNNSIMTKWRGDTFLNNNSTKMQNTHVYAVMYNVSGTKWRVVDNTPTTYQPSVCIRRLLKEKSKWHLSF